MLNKFFTKNTKVARTPYYFNLFVHFHINSFVLSEVLITIGIIGILASLTIPNLITKYEQERTVETLKKTYTSLAQAVAQSELDNGPCKDWDWGAQNNTTQIKASFNTYWAPYLKILNECDTYQACNYSVNVIKALNGADYYNVVGTSGRTVILNNSVMLRIMNGTIVTKAIIVDLNAGKGPNVLGKDVFEFYLDEKKGFMPSAAGNCTKPAVNGRSCALKIMTDGWKISSDYPWD